MVWTVGMIHADKYGKEDRGRRQTGISQDYIAMCTPPAITRAVPTASLSVVLDTN
ncbi:hypothetical protein [Dysgonomonas sp. HGC4]|uniref:hypothetical protein n=1 Tax=Dysgonomonas sp. HGC4 TaxID=1658009 RepID=UPI000B1681F1|nr:hypothetical protein [Dysgonomonas sp. HGC4]MBD8347739.1 hypothetical protein [Dysgonomonas sp. HGC4]